MFVKFISQNTKQFHCHKLRGNNVTFYGQFNKELLAAPPLRY